MGRLLFVTKDFVSRTPIIFPSFPSFCAAGSKIIIDYRDRGFSVLLSSGVRRMLGHHRQNSEHGPHSPQAWRLHLSAWSPRVLQTGLILVTKPENIPAKVMPHIKVYCLFRSDLQFVHVEFIKSDEKLVRVREIPLVVQGACYWTQR